MILKRNSHMYRYYFSRWLVDHVVVKVIKCISLLGTFLAIDHVAIGG